MDTVIDRVGAAEARLWANAGQSDTAKTMTMK
jgi:hypothetical protein